jgi:hypothetical protein
MNRAVAEVRGHVRGQMRAWALDVEMDDTDPFELLGPCNEGVQEDRRRGRGAVDVHLIARLDAGHGRFGGDGLHGRSLGGRPRWTGARNGTPGAAADAPGR